MERITHNGVSGVFYSDEDLKMFQDTLKAQKMLIETLQQEMAQ